MKTKKLLISILAVLFAFPLPGAFAREASDSISIQVITTFDYPAGDVTQTIPEGINDLGDILALLSTRAESTAALSALPTAHLAHRSLSLTILWAIPRERASRTSC